MVIALGSELESILTELARKQGVSPEILAINAIRERFFVSDFSLEPQDEWEKKLRSAASDCSVALSNEAVSSEGLYE